MPPLQPAALDTATEARRRFNRRKFLGLGGGAAAAGVLGAALGPQAFDALFSPAAAARGATRSPRTLVLVTLYGGNDGLNTVIPIRTPPTRRHAGRSPSTPRASWRSMTASVSIPPCPA